MKNDHEPSSNELEECLRDLIMKCSHCLGSFPGVQKITLMPCSREMREWLGMHVKEMGSSPYAIQDGLSALFSKKMKFLSC